jgi:hypothetical protein
MTFLAVVEAGVTIILPAVLLLPVTPGPVLGSPFIGPRLGTAFTGDLLFLHVRLPLLFSE